MEEDIGMGEGVVISGGAREMTAEGGEDCWGGGEIFRLTVLLLEVGLGGGLLLGK